MKMPEYELLGNIYSERTLEAIALVYSDTDPKDISGDQQETYLTAFAHIVAATRDASDYIWLIEQNQEDWPPDSVQEKIRRGMRLGFLWAKSELEKNNVSTTTVTSAEPI